MNGSTGITPTVELATTNGGNGFAYPYPVYPMMNGGGFGNGGFFGGDSAIWLIVLLALIWGNNGNGWGGFGGGNSFDNGYAWLSNGQKEIMQNTNNGFDTLHLSNQLDTVNSGIYSLSNQLCNCCADMSQTVNNGFFNAEIAENNRQMANMNQLFGISTQLCNASADNRLGVASLGSDIAREACATRTSDTQNTQSILNAINNGIVSIKQQLCDDKIDAKNEKILDLQRQLDMADLRASQTAQNAFIAQGLNNEVDALYNRLATCPINTIPVYGNQRIFSCPNNNGCGCNGYATNII